MAVGPNVCNSMASRFTTGTWRECKLVLVSVSGPEQPAAQPSRAAAARARLPGVPLWGSSVCGAVEFGLEETGWLTKSGDS